MLVETTACQSWRVFLRHSVLSNSTACSNYWKTLWKLAPLISLPLSYRSRPLSSCGHVKERSRTAQPVVVVDVILHPGLRDIIIMFDARKLEWRDNEVMKSFTICLAVLTAQVWRTIAILHTGCNASAANSVNRLIATLKPQSNWPSYSKLAIQWLVHWPLMNGLLHLVQRGRNWAGPQPAQTPPHYTKCNSPPINGQCTNFVLFDVAL